MHAENLSHFKAETRKAFATICNNFGFQEETTPLSDTANLFQLTFSNSKIRIIVEGINWGMNATVHIGINESGAALYSIHRLLKERKPEEPVTGSQVDQLYGYAQYLLTNAADIFQGDTHFLDKLEAIRKQEKEDAMKIIEVENARKLAEGYIKIETSYGDTIWRKPRPSLSPFKITKDKFPNCIEVIFNESDLLSGGAPTIITEWKAELDSTVINGDVICEVSTDKVSMEVIAPQTGQLVWLLEEGIALHASPCIALIVPV
ncbi:biotin/lipoyl-containing protein [Niastella sp. OAS944]|uniref:biotin/lipoyl-containing protein n=1 Tax=Niastella sp. OAS944 TaxID=2664089 RepID=UPI0035C86602|nr:hypothetical protein [Chitinophagaceae bacterium OAS944]